MTGYHRAGAGERLAGAAGAGGVVALLLAGLIWGLASGRLPIAEQPATLLSVPVAPPPPSRKPVEAARRKAARDAPAPPNLRNKATAVVAPTPVVPLAPPPPLVVTPRANTGTAPQTGASDRPGPGEGAGGDGNGTGGGGEGEGGGYTAPRQIRGRLKNSDLPPELVHDQDADGVIGSVAVRYHVEMDGRVGACGVTRSSGKPVLDAMTCRLIQERFRFRPSRDPDGRPVAADIVETHTWGVVHDDGPAPDR